MALVAGGACSHSSEKYQAIPTATSQIHRRHVRRTIPFDYRDCLSKDIQKLFKIIRKEKTKETYV